MDYGLHRQMCQPRDVADTTKGEADCRRHTATQTMLLQDHGL
jgi:hypothetical protein